MIKLPDQETLDFLTNQGPNSGHRDNLAYTRWQGQTFTNPEFYFCLFHYCQFSNCYLRYGDFDKSDITGTGFYNTEFHQTSLSGIASKANRYQNCSFFSVSFRVSNIKNSTFSYVKFENISFEECEIYNNRFIGCHFESIDFGDSATTFCHFENCTFSSCTIGNATILYLTFKACRFLDTWLTLESLGYVAGLSFADLEQLNFLYLGREETRGLNSQLLSDLIETYLNRGWIVGYIVLLMQYGEYLPEKFNDSFTSHPALMGTYQFSKFIEQLLYKRRIVDVDEISFFTRIIKNKCNNNDMPMLALIQFYEVLLVCQHSADQEPDLVSDSSTLATAVSRLEKLLKERMSIFSQIVSTLDQIKAQNPSDRLNLTIVEQSEPKVQTSEIILAVMENRYGEAQAADLISIDPPRESCFLEFVTITLACIEIPLTILSLLGKDLRALLTAIRGLLLRPKSSYSPGEQGRPRNDYRAAMPGMTTKNTNNSAQLQPKPDLTVEVYGEDHSELFDAVVNTRDTIFNAKGARSLAMMSGNVISVEIGDIKTERKNKE